MNRFEESITGKNGTESEGTGYLIVRVATARSAIPLEDALVTVRAAALASEEIRSEEDARSEGEVIASLTTDRDGLAPRLALPAPSRSLSESPGNVTPYALYDIDVSLDGYETHYYQNVPVFDTVTSLQTVELIPLSEGQRPENGISPPSVVFRVDERETL